MREAHSPVSDLEDVRSFLARLPRTGAGFLLPDEPLVVTRAPGRLDLMGGIADYSGSLVLQYPVREATLAALQRTSEPVLRIVSRRPGAGEPGLTFSLPMSYFGSGPPVDYTDARREFAADPSRHWAAYAAGAFLVLARERGARFDGGARLLIESTVPEGKGVSSSAAIEVAVMQAAAAAWGISLDARELALLCQKVENLVVGAPCGVMDQMASACGEEGKLLALLCQPAELQGTTPLPEDVAVWGLDSGVRHAVTGADYGSVRIGAFMGYRVLAEHCGFRVTPAGGGRVMVDDPRWHGFLANVTPSEFESGLAAALPERITGREFLERCGGTTDPVTRVEPERSYAVRMPTAHPIYENFRVRAFAELLDGGVTERRLELLGELMYQSHASYSACGLGSAATDRLVHLAREAGPGCGLYGAKITGGGSGGTVAVLGRRDADSAVQAVAERYAAESGRPPYVFSGSSPGAAAFGFLRVKW